MSSTGNVVDGNSLHKTGYTLYKGYVCVCIHITYICMYIYTFICEGMGIASGKRAILNVGSDSFEAGSCHCLAC